MKPVQQSEGRARPGGKRGEAVGKVGRGFKISQDFHQTLQPLQENVAPSSVAFERYGLFQLFVPILIGTEAEQ